MYYYIVDPEKLSQGEFERVQNQLYSSVSQFRVSGEVVRCTGLRTITQLVETAFSHNAKTIVAVGSDDTLQEVINAVGNREIVIGFIPIHSTPIGEILGLGSIEQCVKTIAARRIAEMDLGMANNNLFFSHLNFGSLPEVTSGWLGFLNYRLIKNLHEIPAFEIKFSADEQFQATLPVVAASIQNLSNPTDGKLDVLLLPSISSWNALKYRQEILSGNFEKIPGTSILHVKKIEITAPTGLPLKTEGRLITKTPAVIEIRPRALKIIVGKERKF